ncbi:MAG: alpha/beta hydrolase [Burkholderiales bacterium]|nr:alpha/beta hydrolase [Burkholderiales bacterium]
MKFQVDGRQAYAYTGGKPFDAGLPCVVFIHGAMHDHSGWTLLARWCAHHGYGVLAVNQPGHGRSEGPPLPSVQALADWTLALMSAAGVPQATLVGHSMGTLIALEAAARAPERVSRLVLLGTAYPMKVSDALLNTARETPLKAIDMVNALSISTPASKPSYPGPGMWVHGSNRALMRNQQALSADINLFEHDFKLCDAYAGGAEAMAKVQCPATLIVGARDQMTPPKATKELATALKARVVTVPAGHHMLAEAPDAVLAGLRGALGA